MSMPAFAARFCAPLFAALLACTAGAAPLAPDQAPSPAARGLAPQASPANRPFASVVAAGASTATSKSMPGVNAAVGNQAASWLIGQQFANGGFPWSKGDASAAPNTQGATALGLLRAWDKNHDPVLLAAAKKNGDCQLAGESCIAGSTYNGAGGGHHRFASHDPLFLHRLSIATGDAAYDNFVDTEFWGRLAGSSYGASANLDLGGYIANVFSARSSIPELVAWDLAKLAIAADELGHDAERDALMTAIRSSLEQAGPGTGHTTYDELALAGAIWASAATGIDLDPGAGGWASANSTADLAAMLAALQISAAPNAGAFSDTSSGVAGGGSDGPNTQATAYAMLALDAVNPSAYATNITNGYAYIRAQQQGDGQILYRVGSLPTEAGGVESHAESLESYALNQFQPDRWVGPSGTDTGDCSNSATRCRTIAYAIAQAARYDTIHVAAGNYVVNASLNVALEGLKIVGDDPLNKPVVTRAATFGADANQPLLTIANAKNVRIANLDFQVDRTYAAEGIQAYGIVDGLLVEGNRFSASKSGSAEASFGRRNALSINLVNRQDGSFVRVLNNVIDGQNAGVPGSILFRAGVAMDAGVGMITGNTIAAQSHDVIVRFATANANSSEDGVLIQNNQLQFGGVSFTGPNASAGAVMINGNTITAPAYANAFPNEADFALGRIIANSGNIALTISNNQFSGHVNHFRGLLIENFPNVTLTGNTFTPASGATDFASLVLSNKELTTDNPPGAPRPLGVVAKGNTFNGSNVAGAGTAVMLIDDNDANGAATYGGISFGGAGVGEANVFDANLQWYYYLRDETCSTTTTTIGSTPGGTNPQCTFLGYNAVGALPNTEVRPFAGDVGAAHNVYDGAAPSPATISAIQARTRDDNDIAALGVVLYGVTPSAVGTIDFAPTTLTFDGAAHAIAATLEEDASATCTVVPATVTNAGDTSVAAHCTSFGYDVVADATIHVAKAIGTAQLAQTSFTYDGSAQAFEPSMVEEPGATCLASPASVTNAGNHPVAVDCSGTNYDAHATISVNVAKATGSIELAPSHFDYTNTDQAVNARIAQEPVSACAAVSPAIVHNVGSHAIHVAACSGTNYDAPASDLIATVGGGTAVHVVDTNQYYATVADALADAATLADMTVELAPGNYGPIVLTKGVHLVGSASFTPMLAGVTTPPATIIDGGGILPYGIVVANDVMGASISGVEIRNFTQHCIAANQGNDGLAITENVIHGCGSRGISVSGIAATGITGVTIDHNEVYATGDRGIVVWDGIKRDITITNNWVHDLAGCCGIELQDGAATGAIVTDNVVENTGDSGMAFIQLTSGSPTLRANQIARNTISNTGRFGMEIKIPNGSGAASGDGAIVVEDNIVTSPGMANLRDRAGIAVIRRALSPAYSFELDRTRGVVVRNNTVSGFRTTDTSQFEGYGIVVEGLGSSVSGNILSNNDIGLQVQQGNPNGLPPGDSDQNFAAGDWFGRGNAPFTCVSVDANTISASIVDDQREVPAGASMIGSRVLNQNTGARYCSINSAVAAASTGDVLVADAGSYAENVVIDKAVTLRGAKAGDAAGVGGTRDPSSGESIIVPATIEPGLSLSSTSQAVIEIDADDVTVDGFVIDGDNAALASPVALNGANPDVSAGVFARGNGMHLQNLVLRNLTYVGIDGYATSSPSGDNHIVDNRFVNITAPSLWGIGVLLQDNFYAEVAGNLMDEVRVGVQTNNDFAAAPGGFAPSITGNEIHATRTAIFHNLFYGTATAYAITGNTLVAAANAAQAGGWKGLWLESMGNAQTVTITGNAIDGSALFGGGRTTTGYVLNNVTSTAPAAAIDGGSVSHVDVGVLSTDATGYTGPVNDFIVRNVAFDDIALGALYVEDTQEQAGSAKLSVGTGNTYTASVAHTLALSGATPAVGHGGGAIPNVLVRSARTFFNGAPSNGPCTPAACTVVSAQVSGGVAAVDSGGIVDLEDGTYAQNVVLGKSLTLRGPHHGEAGYAAGRGSSESVIAPASGIGLVLSAATVAVDGVAIQSSGAHAVQRQAGDPADNLRFANNRITGVVDGSGIFSEPGASGAGDGFLIERNLFSNISGSGSQNGRGIVLFKGTRNAQVVDNRFEGIQQHALQANGGSGTLEQLTVTGNVAVAMSPIVSATAFVITGASNVQFQRNTVSGTGGGLFVSDRTADFEASCNVLAATGSAISTSDFFGSASNSNVRIFDNALAGGSFDLSSQMAQGLVVGSNWYDGAAPAINGASLGLLVADPLLADPTNGGAFDVAACGDNTPMSIVAYAGSPQSTPVTSAFSPLHARIEDALGGAVMGQPITLFVPSSGASAVLGTSSGASNYNGELISSATANAHAGSYLVGADSSALHADFALTNTQGIGTVVFDNTSLVYTGAAQALLAHVAEDPTATCTLTPPTVTNAGSYPVSANCSGDDYTASGGTTVVVAKAAGTVTFDSLTYTGAAQTVTAHITEEPATSCTVVPATLGPAAGSYPVSATCTGSNYDASGNGVVVIAKAASTITINPADLDQNYGSTHAVGASAAPISSGHVDVTYDGSATAPSAVGSYSVLATLVDPNYEAAPASALLTIGDAAAITITAQSTQAMALVGSGAPYTDFVDYTGTLRNAGASTGQAVHTVLSVVRIDDGNTSGENPIAIDAADVEACIYDPSGWAAQDPGNHNGCPQDYESLVFSQGAGAYNGRPAVTFRYPVNPAYDQPLPTIDPSVATPPAKFRFKRGDYQVHVSLVGTDGRVYASAFGGTTVPEASITYDGATSGQAEDALLSTTRLRNTGGRVDGTVIVRVTLSDAASSESTPIPLVAGDVEFAYQLGETYFTLPWAGSATDGGLVTYFGPGNGFPLEDGYDAITAGRGIFHREGSYRLTYEVLDAATQTAVFASSTTAPLTIGPNLVNFALSDLAQVYDGTPRAVTVTPNGVPHTTVYEPRVGASCPASPGGSNSVPPINADTYCVYVSATGTYQGSAQGTLVVAKASSSVSLTDDDGTVDGTIHRTFNATAQVVGATSTPTVASIALSYDGSPTAPSAAGTYGVVATVVDPNYTGQATGTLIVAANGGATIVLDAPTLTATWDGAPHAATATTTPGGIAYAVTYEGDGATVYPQSATAPNAAGQYHVVATTTDANYAPVSASGTLVIASAGAGIALDAGTLTATWDGNPHAVTATTTPTGLAYTVTYDGLLDPPSAVGSYSVVATIDDANHNAAPAIGTLVISAASTAIVLDAPTLTASYDGQPHVVTATTTPSGLAYAVTYDGSATPPVNAGSYAIVATVTVAGHSGSASGTLTIAKATGVVSFSATNATFDGTPHAIGALISQEPGNGTACTLTATGDYPRVNAGSTTIDADCDGTNYTASASTTLLLSPRPVTIGLSGLGSFPYDGGAHAASAAVAGTVAGSPADVVVTYTPGGASAPIAVGSYEVVAVLDAASTNYTAPAANGTITIGTANASVTLGNLAQVYDGTPRLATASTTPAGLALGLSYDGSATAPTEAGTYTVVATITEPGYSGSASGTLVVSKASATVLLADLAATYDGNPHAASATTTPGGLAISLTYDGGAAAPTNAGSYAVVATVTDPNHTGSASGTLTIAKAAATVTLSDLSQVYNGTPRPVTVTTTPNVATDVTYDGNATAPNEVGTYSVVATVTDPNYSGSANGTLHVVSGDANAIAANGATTFNGTAGQALAGALPSVKVTDAGGHPVAGIAVTFAAGSGDGTLSGAEQTTDQNGVATLGGWVLDASAGTDTVVATASGVAGDVTFTATSAADAGGLALTITDGRTATQVGRSLTYTITIGNGGTSNALAVSVSDTLPAELDAATAHWQCIPINGALCTADGDGDLADTVDLPAGSSVVYLLSATVIDDVDGMIGNTVDAGSASATDDTEIVIFRDGFDGGDGAEALGHAIALGRLGNDSPLSLPIVPTTFASLARKELARAVDGSFRVEAIRIDGDIYVRLVTTGSGAEGASAWARVVDASLVLGLAGGRLTLSGTDAVLDLALSAKGVAVVGAGD
jgi:uncharacterized repeat protein (TIGR01451 family)